MQAYYRYALILLVTVSAPINAELYKWVDEQGRVHYGDKPKTGANVEQLKLDKKKAKKKTPVAVTKTMQSDESPVIEARPSDQHMSQDEIRKLSNMSPGELQKYLEGIQDKQKQIQLGARHQVELEQEQQEETARERAEKDRAEAKKREKELEKIRPKIDKNGRITNMKEIRKHYGLD